MTSTLEPDQQPLRWDDYAALYEHVFEPLTQRWSMAAIDALRLEPQSHVLDSAAGTGGAALELARRDHRVTAIDASLAMVARTKERASAMGLTIEALTMDGEDLAFPDASFDAAISVLGVILFPDAVRGLSELRRVVRPGGRIALITWTAPEAYELVGELRAAALSVLGSLPTELILRESAIFGILGIKTLGYYVDAAISELRIDTAALLLVGVAVLSMSVDAFSRHLRRRLRIEALPVRLSADHLAHSARSTGAYTGATHAQQPVA
jgi:SAM-dependent methyltransferase